MLNIDEIQNGIVIDHIKAGTAIGLMDLLVCPTKHDRQNRTYPRR